MGLKRVIIDSFRYTSSNWLKVIVLGLVIYIADIVNEISFLGTSAVEIDILLIIGGTILGIFEIGYVFRILEESTHGSDVLPKYNKIMATFVHGIKEILVTISYFALPFILILIGIEQIKQIIGFISPGFDTYLIFSGLILGSFLYIPFQAALLNMAYHHGSLRSGFDLKKIAQNIRNMGFKNIGFIYILSVFFAVVVEYTLSDTLSILPYGLGDLITGLFIAPFILILTARALGLINRGLDI